MKKFSLTKLGVLLLTVFAVWDAKADQYLYGYGWTGGNGTTNQCLLSNGPSAQPAFGSCSAGGGGGTVTSLTAGAGLTASPSTITTTGSFSLDLTAANIFSGAQTFSGSQYWKQVGAGTDLGVWGCVPSGGLFTCSTFTDALGAGKAFLTITRGTTTAIGGISVGNATDNPNFTLSGTGNINTGGVLNGAGLSVSGSANAARYNVTASTVATNGIYLPATNTIGFSTNSGSRGSIGPTGLVSWTNGTVIGGTKFTAAGTGCTVGTTVGGATAGTFTLAAGPCTSVAITMAGATGATATNGWTCQAHDKTAPTVLIGGESSSTTTAATITIPAGAGTADVISFSCTGY